MYYNLTIDTQLEADDEADAIDQVYKVFANAGIFAGWSVSEVEPDDEEEVLEEEE